MCVKMVTVTTIEGNLKHLVEKKILIKYCLLQSLMILPATDDVAK